MIVMVELKTGEPKKTMVRNKVFHEVTGLNRKMEKIPGNTIAAVYWPQKGKMEKFDVKTWVEMAEANNYWNISE